MASRLQPPSHTHIRCMAPIPILNLMPPFNHTIVIVKASSGPRYVVGCRSKVDKAKMTQGTRVALDMTTLTIMRALPREVSQARAIKGGFLRQIS